MAVKEPKSMDELVYFTKRDLDNGKGEVTCWTYKGNCPECGKGKMGKPINEKTGKAKIRAKEYVCPECKHTVEKEEYEETLMAQAKYKCPECSASGEIEFPFKRKTVQLFDVETQKKKAAKALQFPCEKCGYKINITKKMKE